MLLVLVSVYPGFAQSSEQPTDTQQAWFGGPDTVPNRIESELVDKDTLFEFEFLKPYYDLKDRILEKYGYAYALDYYPIYLKASDSLPGTDDDAASAVLRFSGFWQLLGRAEDSNSSGTLVYLVEHRHRYTDNLPSEFALESLGYAGFIGIPYGNEGGLHLTNLYWNQEWQNGFGFAAGFLDVTDWVDVWALTSPWTDFYNFVFSIGAATMDLPDDAALGFGAGGWLADKVYLIAGFEDLNADPTDPFEGFDTFFNDNEYFKHVEIGWVNSAFLVNSAALAGDRNAAEQLVDAFIQYAARPSAETFAELPLNDTVALGLGPEILTTVNGSALQDSATWELDLEYFRGATGPFSILEGLERVGDYQVTVGPHDHCASPPMPAPAGYEDLEQVSVQPADGSIDSCLLWSTVDLFVTADGDVAAITLDFWEP